MPEGDTIFRASRALHKALAGAMVTGFKTVYARLASANDDTVVTGRTVEKVEARGKWLLIHFSGDLILVTHMLMSGSWHIYRPGERWKRPRADVRIILRTAEYEAVAFSIPVAQFHTAGSLERNTAIPKLGPDLLKDEFAEDEAKARIRAHADEEIGNVLLNQRVMAGVGNVFKSEICFVCGVHPFRRVSSLSDREIGCLVDSARRLMGANITDTSGDQIVTYTGLRRTTGRSDPTARVWVYRRKGEPCRRCGTVIRDAPPGAGGALELLVSELPAHLSFGGNGLSSRAVRYNIAMPPLNLSRRRQKSPPPGETGQEALYLRFLSDKQVRVAVKLRDGEVVSGWIEYFDDRMIRLTRDGKPNLFIYKNQIRTITEQTRRDEGRRRGTRKSTEGGGPEGGSLGPDDVSSGEPR